MRVLVGPDRALASGAVSADWETVYDEHSREILGYLAKLVGDREVASELMQETFIRAIRAEATLRDPAAIRGWLFRTATNLAMSDRRRRALLRFLPFTGLERAPVEAFDAEAHAVRTALGSIPSDQAATLLLHYHSGFERAEIAALSGISEEAVKSRIARGRKGFMAAYRRLERGLAR